jgi:hypothetical protein
VLIAGGGDATGGNAGGLSKQPLLSTKGAAGAAGLQGAASAACHAEQVDFSGLLLYCSLKRTRRPTPLQEGVTVPSSLKTAQLEVSLFQMCCSQIWSLSEVLSKLS